MAQVKILQGMIANLPSKSTEGAIYFTKDENIYLGLADGQFKRYGDFNVVTNVAALPESGANEKALYYCAEENVLARYDKEHTKWVQINPNTNTTYKLEAGSKNGTLKLVGSDKTSVEIAVTGLGSAAFTEANAYAEKAHKHEIADVNGLTEAIADAKKAGTDAQTTIGEVTPGKTVVQLIEEAKTAATYDDTEVKQSIATLNGSDTGKSVRTIANEELAAQLITPDAQESMNTLQEIAAWIQKHPEDASAMNASIVKLQGILAGIGGDSEKATVVAYVTDAIAALKIGEYAKASELTALAAKVDTVEKKLATVEENAQVNKIEEIKVNGVAQNIEGKSVNIAVPTGALASKDKVAETDLDTALAEKVNAAAEGNHSHANKEVLDSITSEKIKAWDAAQTNVIESVRSDTLAVSTSGKEVTVNLEWGTF